MKLTITDHLENNEIRTVVMGTMILRLSVKMLSDELVNV